MQDGAGKEKNILVQVLKVISWLMFTESEVKWQRGIAITDSWGQARRINWTASRGEPLHRGGIG